MVRCKVWLVAMGVLIIPGLVAAWTTPINISNTEMKSTAPAIAIGKQNSIHVVWTDFHTDPWTPGEVLYRYSDGDIWFETINVSSDTTSSQDPQIAIDTSGYPHVIWEDWGGPAKVYYSYFTGDSFTTPVCLSDSLQPGAFVRLGDIAVDSMNSIHIVWSAETESVFEVYYVRGEDGSWSLPVNISNNPSGNSSIPRMAIGSGDNLHVVWRENETDTSYYKEIYYSKFDGDSWSTPVNISNLPNYSSKQQIAVSPEGYPHVVWDEDYHIYYSFYNGDGWSTPFPVSDSLTGEKGYLPDIIVDLNSYPHIVWGGEGPELWHTYYDGTSWITPVDVSGSSPNSGGPEITVDHSNCLHLVWWEGFEIYYSRHQLTDIEEGNGGAAKEKVLPLPNPFGVSTTIPYTLLKDSRVRLEISDITGRILIDLDLGYRPKGNHSLCVPAEFIKRGGGSGIYFYTIEAYGEVIARGKLILLR